MAYAQWVSFTVKVKGFAGTTDNANLSWGKFYKYDNKDEEIADVNGTKFQDGRVYNTVISSCGRSVRSPIL